MKRILLAVAILACVLPAGQAKAGVDVSIDFFYDNLSDGGNWVEVGDYGYCWQPTVAVSNTNWRPYSDGYWAYTDVGWTWVSYEDFGWATYHYGRWMRIRGRGWVWVPGREWGPAWVSWRTGGDYIGWAPLPPRRAGEYWDERPITSRVDIEFDIGPAYYNFVDVRYIGEPVLRERIFAPEQNVTYITKTVNVTNITYTNSTVYNYGPDYETVSRYSTRPIQRLTIQREANVDPSTAVRSKSVMKVEGDKLVVAAPPQFQKPTKQHAPKVVKEKIAQAPVEKGWEQVADPKAQAELKAKMKKEDPKSVPPPTVQASDKTATTPAPSSPATTTSSSTPEAAPNAGTTATPPTAARPTSSPAGDKDKDKRRNIPAVVPGATATVSPGTTPVATPERNKNKRNEKVPPSAAPSASVSPATSPAPTRDKGKNKERENVAPNPAIAPSTEITTRSVAPKGPKEKPNKPKSEPQAAPRIAPPATPAAEHNKPAPDTTKPEAAVEKPKHDRASDVLKKAPLQENVAPPPANAPVKPAPPAKDEGRKQKKNEPATSPTP